GAYRMIAQDRVRIMGVNLNKDLMDRLRENRTEESITILPAEPGWDAIETGYELPLVGIMIAVVVIILVIAVYLIYMKWWKSRKMHP
ncbi:MAG: hypothetical protein ACMUFK_04695, partial [Thermoplasmatota archaeon]